MSLHPSVAAVRVAVRRTLAELVAEQPRAVLPPDAAVLAACSGGPDSLALVSAAVFEGHKLGFRVIGVTERVGQFRDGRWRDVVLLERRSTTV